MKTLKIIFGVFLIALIAFQFIPIEYHSTLTDIVFGSSLSGISIASIYTPGCGNPPPITCEDCPEIELGGVRSIWIQKDSYTFTDITDPNEWEAAICAQNVFVFPFTNGTVAMDPNMSDGFGNTPTALDSYTYTIDFKEPQYVKNVPFWNFVKSGNSYLVGYKTQTLLHLSLVPAQFTPMAPVAKDVKTRVNMTAKATFVQADLIQPIAAGAAEAIFETCTDC